MGAAFFTAEVRKDFAESLRPLGRLTAITAVSKASHGGLVEEVYAAAYGARSLRIVARRKGERYEQFSVLPR